MKNYTYFPYVFDKNFNGNGSGVFTSVNNLCGSGAE